MLIGAGSEGTKTGFRMGSMIGWRSADRWSINGEVSYDYIRVIEPPGVSASEHMVMVAFSPLFNVTTPSADIAFGPKLGFWKLSAELSDSYTQITLSEEGWSWGANIGLFFPISAKASLGGLLSLDTFEPTRACATQDGEQTQCVTSGFATTRMLGLSLAALL
jgi:hypothetical protein